MAIDVFVTAGDEKSTCLSDKCIEFLEASAQPEMALNGYASRITPKGWSGSRADILERNTSTLATLIDHQNPEIAVAARLVMVIPLF